VWSLGITLIEVLTQRVPAWDAARMEMAAPDLSKNLPEPFRAIVQRCFRVDPGQRIKLREIAERLEGREARPAEKPASLAEAPATKPGRGDAISATARKRANGPYWLVLAVAIAVIVFLVLRPRPSTQPAEVQSSTSPTQNASPQDSTPQSSTPQNSTPQSHAPQSPAQQSSSQQSSAQEGPAQQSPAQPNSAQRVPAQQASPPPRAQAAPAERQTAQLPSNEAARGEQKSPTSSDEIIERPMPQVARSAQRTIHGKLKVRVRVEADAAGNVTDAKLKDAGPSPYFAHAALEAARRWKFAPAADGDSREWTLLFAFSRARIEMSASRAP
jgi:TonB family protein